jgi:predicted nucleic acid-binding protein
LYTRVLAPNTVVEEMRQAGTPASVRSWISQPPDWLDVRPDTPSDATLSFLGRAEVVRRDLRVTGTLGVLVLAHQRELLDFETARPINNRPAG